MSRIIALASVPVKPTRVSRPRPVPFGRGVFAPPAPFVPAQADWDAYREMTERHERVAIDRHFDMLADEAAWLDARSGHYTDADMALVGAVG